MYRTLTVSAEHYALGLRDESRVDHYKTTAQVELVTQTVRLYTTRVYSKAVRVYAAVPFSGSRPPRSRKLVLLLHITVYSIVYTL